MPSKRRTWLDVLLTVVFSIFVLLAAFFSFFLWREISYGFLTHLDLLFWAVFATLIAITLGSFTAGLILIGTTKDGLVDTALDVFVTSWLALFTLLPAFGTALVIQNLFQGIGEHRGFYVVLLGVCTAFFGTLLYRKIVLRTHPTRPLSSRAKSDGVEGSLR